MPHFSWDNLVFGQRVGAEISTFLKAPKFAIFSTSVALDSQYTQSQARIKLMPYLFFTIGTDGAIGRSP